MVEANIDALTMALSSTILVISLGEQLVIHTAVIKLKNNEPLGPSGKLFKLSLSGTVTAPASLSTKPDHDADSELHGHVYSQQQQGDDISRRSPSRMLQHDSFK
jgi:hypothetical protein